MKNKILAAILVAAAAIPLVAQTVVGPTRQDVFTTTSTVVVNGNVSSNLPASLVKAVKVGASGFGVAGTFGVTNAITNGTTLTFEIVADYTGTNVNAMSSGNAQLNTLTMVVPAVGTTPFYYFTNVPGTAQNIANAPAIRLKTVNPTNATSAIFITNLYIWSR